jgi:hypothetical protein
MVAFLGSSLLLAAYVIDLAVIARSTCDEAIHSSFVRRDGLLRFARNDGEGAEAYLTPVIYSAA